MQRIKVFVLQGVAGLIAAGLLATPDARALTASLDLGLLPTTGTVNRMNIDLEVDYNGTVLRDSELTRLSGNVLSDIDYEIVGGAPVINGISLTGGQVTVRGASTNNVTFSFGVPFLAGVNITGANIAGTFDTPFAPSNVSNNQFLAADHEVVLNQGTLTAVGSGLLSNINETLDLATDPLPLSQDTGFGSISLVQVGGQVGLQKTYEITVTLPVDDTQVIPIDNNGSTIPVTIDVSGSVVARDTFTITVPLAGDYNDDGMVDAADYLVWRNSAGSSGAGLPADGNGDMQITGADYTIWKDNFGESSQAAGALVLATAVPEPTSLALAGLMAAAGLAVARRRMG
jgi:hypothetical protein